MQQGVYITFWADFHFLQDRAYFWQTDLYRTMLIMSQQVSLPVISSILEDMKIGPKRDIRPFCTKAFNNKY